MRLAHLADLHLGFRRYTRQTGTGINQREADVATAFRHAVNGLIDAAPDVIVIAGDLFHSVRPTNPAILDSFNQFRRLNEALPDTPIILIAGNHDTPRAVETGSILALFEAVGVHVVAREPQTLVFDDRDLAVFAVPYGTIRTGRPTMVPESTCRWNVLVTHGEVAGVLPPERSGAEYGGVVIEPDELHADQWDYVALGHYHVAQQVTPNAWYAGALEFVTSNPWGELREGDALGWGDAKGWLLATLRDGPAAVEFVPVARGPRHIDLAWIEAGGMSASDLDAALAAAVAGVVEGIDDQVVRQVVTDVPRNVSRDLDHAAIREYKTRAVHYHLDLRRPVVRREIGVAAPGTRQTLNELVDDYLRRRELTPGVDRGAVRELARRYLDDTTHAPDEP